MNQLDLCGTSGRAPFYLSLKRGLDVLLSHPNADPQRVAVAGLSGGGWQTIFISALDERVTLSNPVVGYSSFRTRARYLTDLGDSEQTPCDLATVTDYAQLTALRALRPTLLTKNAEDTCCFRAEHVLPPLLEAACPVYALYGKPSHLRYHVNHDPGNHNFELDNRQQLYRMFGDFFFAEQTDFDWQEIPSQDEGKSAEQLDVDLSDDNADFNMLARQLSQSLPEASAARPAAEDDVAAWRNVQRHNLRETVGARDCEVVAVRIQHEITEDLEITWWWLRIGGSWTMPAVEIKCSESSKCGPAAIIVADAGRALAVEPVESLLDRGYCVLAVDPFYIGESKISQCDCLFALLVAAVGDRPVGLQSSQLAAVARRFMSRNNGIAPELIAVGPRLSLAALIAAALEPKAIACVELHQPLTSLHEVIESSMSVKDVPELFCFGLLKHFDIPQIVELGSPREAEFVEPPDDPDAPLTESE